MQDYIYEFRDKPETKLLVNPHKVYVDLSKKLYDMKIELLDRMSES